ncbi:MAG: four-carbon acid sugar kinase family protein, partial [Mycobacterium leprae]
MRHIAIVADDLTGASDSGVQFARKGLKTSVLFSTQSLAVDTVGVESIAVDTDSRAIPSGEAYARA